MLMKKAFRALLISLSVATGCLFLYSAYTKLYPIQSFENSMVEFLHLPLKVAAIAARFFIGLEGGLGTLLLLHLFGKNKWALKTAFILLLAFTVYLVCLWMIAGNDVNCGCFGDYIWMRPSASLIKNILLLGVIGLLLRYHKGFTYRWATIAAPVLLLCAFALSYIFFPVFKPYKIDLSPVYSDKNSPPSIDLTRGKHIIGFFSPFCKHCRKAAFEMHELKEKNPAIPFYMLVYCPPVLNDSTGFNDFWKESQAQNIPHSYLDIDPFNKIVGGYFPSIIWVNDGLVEANTSNAALNEAVIEKWLK